MKHSNQILVLLLQLIFNCIQTHFLLQTSNSRLLRVSLFRFPVVASPAVESTHSTGADDAGVHIISTANAEVMYQTKKPEGHHHHHRGNALSRDIPCLQLVALLPSLCYVEHCPLEFWINN